jgi:N-6 DNA Methylase
MAKLHTLTLIAHRQGFGDFFGDIYQDCNFTNEKKGQFFTPYPLCQVSARMILGNVRDQVEKTGVITISDPASGAGAMLIAAASELYEQEVDPRQVAQFEGIDIDRDCFNMTYIQLAALDLQAVVRHGNTLSGEMWESRPTPQLRYFEQWLEQRRAEEKPLAMLAALRELINAPLDTAEDTAPAQEPAVNSAIPEPAAEQLTLTPSPIAQPHKKKRSRADVVIDREQLTQQLSLFEQIPINE